MDGAKFGVPKCACRVGIRIELAGLLLALVTVSGCMIVRKLPDGQQTLMNDKEFAIRSSLHVSAPASPVYLTYQQAGRCSYNYTTDDGKGTVKKFPNDQIVRAVGDKIQIVQERQNNTIDNINIASLIIDHNGRVYDYNSKNTQYKSELQSAEVMDTHNMYPEFNINPMLVGQLVSESRMTQTTLFFKFSGTSIYKGYNVAILDILLNVQGQMYSMGFDLVDVKTAVPILWVISAAGTTTVRELIQCTN